MEPLIFARPTRSVAAWLTDPVDAQEHGTYLYVVTCCGRIEARSRYLDEILVVDPRAARRVLADHLHTAHGMWVDPEIIGIRGARPCAECWGHGGEARDCEPCNGTGWVIDEDGAP